jgi:hypothetical protein
MLLWRPHEALLRSRSGADDEEIHKFLTDPNYRGDEHYPVYVEPDPDLGPGWPYGPDEMEATSEDGR